jgi:apolipoprotein N-acyltransferase
VLDIDIAGREGATPYLRVADAPALALAILLFVGGIRRSKQGRKHE